MLPRQQLSAGAARLGLALSPAVLDALMHYLALIEKWNRVYNLTAIRDPAQMVTHHLLDSLSIVPFVRGGRLLDVGSGAGLPGVAIAAVMPDLKCTLLDCNGKKTRFLTQVAIELKLPNIEVVQSRVEDYRPAFLFDCIVSRAFADLAEFIALAAPLLGKDGQLLAMKSARAEIEAQAISDGTYSGWSLTTHPLAVPDLDAARCLIVAQRVV
jgi:16S rRNA (guanine527-N7)-methyltransferase